MCTGLNSGNTRHFEVKGAGHYGIFSGKRWRNMVYPVLKDFILANNGAAGTAKADKVKSTQPELTHITE